MTQKSNSRIVIDTNKHGIRRETNLDKQGKKAVKKKKWERDPHWKKKTKLNTETNTTEL
jgi:hypothetical protein